MEKETSEPTDSPNIENEELSKDKNENEEKEGSISEFGQRAVKIKKLNDSNKKATKVESTSMPKGKTKMAQKFATFITKTADTLEFNKNDNSYFLRLPTPGLKRVVVQKFKGKNYVGVREFYQKDGQELPSPKGINLNMEQWRMLCNAVDEINKCLEKINSR
ncbi:Putative RNA polymerase II transcriptional coactivator [Reticulomyxa filosa]|uniref:Putative RNA polymerase II transcriptional coactivator n=1 Tax=Reticulomyxa filosa TaxID=46433 RepID=X6LQX3_RETFI|nr:Putative RNA polymerase II transcriptional coactivator [Reticulomyxa filosa]|eukprot:ETO04019.1 Putative RNA polymerase II transcriptional coactivator [Reticulomyxa filosa]